MKNYIAIFFGSKTGNAAKAWDALTPVARTAREQAGMKAWAQWSETHARAIVAGGGPLGKTKLVNKDGISDTQNEICAYSIVQAESHAAAAKMFENHPHFAIFPGDSIEVLEQLPIPTQG